MRVVLATSSDVPGWLRLAAEVEHLFGRMVDDLSFHRALLDNVRRSQAHCIREGDGEPGTPLIAAALFDERSAPRYEITWLAVSARARRSGMGRLLVSHLLDRAVRPSSVRVVTFGEDVAGGEPARRLYETLGFRSCGPAGRGPEGGTREALALELE